MRHRTEEFKQNVYKSHRQVEDRSSGEKSKWWKEKEKKNVALPRFKISPTIPHTSHTYRPDHPNCGVTIPLSTLLSIDFSITPPAHRFPSFFRTKGHHARTMDSSSVQSSVPSTPRPVPPKRRSQSEDGFETPRASRTRQPTAFLRERRARSRAASRRRIFQESEVIVGLTPNTARSSSVHSAHSESFNSAAAYTYR